MRTVRLDITLDSRSIEKAIRTLKAEKKELQKRLDELCKRLAELGATSMKASHEEVWMIYTYDSGHAPSTFTVEKIDDGYMVKAEGTDVLFIEFGAGITYGSGHPSANGITTGVGTYSLSDGSNKALSPNGWWTPEGQHTYGNPPACGLVNAEIDISEQIQTIVDEVFS